MLFRSVVFGGRGNCRRRCPGAAPLFCSQRRLCLVKGGGNKAGSDRFPAFSLLPIKNFLSFFRINTQWFPFSNYKTKKCLLYSRNFAAYNKGKRERTGRFRTPAENPKGGSEKIHLEKAPRPLGQTGREAGGEGVQFPSGN